jgi:hypothetical protein
MTTQPTPSPALVRAALASPAQKHNLTPEEENAWIAHYRDRGMTASTDAAILRDHIRATVTAMREEARKLRGGGPMSWSEARKLDTWADRLEGKETTP